MKHFIWTAAIIWVLVIFVFLLLDRADLFVVMPRGWSRIPSRIFYVVSLYGWTVLVALAAAALWELGRVIFRLMFR